MDMHRHFFSGSVNMIILVLILSPEMKFRFCQNDWYEIHTVLSFIAPQ